MSEIGDLGDLYPPTPANVPRGLTSPPAAYQRQVLVVLTCLLLFLVLYIGLVVGSGFFCYWCFAQLGDDQAAVSGQRYTPQPHGQDYRSRSARVTERSEFWLVIGGIASGVLCLFLVKGLFKRQPIDPSMQVEINEHEQPLLFEFIHRVCGDTGAPRPKRVVLTPEVNAAVFYHSSFLSLFLPTRKNLLIGLGLVNQLNLSEFKAVLAHEFGHFSQKSMKLGRYVYTSNRIIGDIVFGRDWLDRFVAVLRGIDLRIAVFAWAFTGVLWGVRKTLQGLFKVINFANSSLSRRMEFNADLVAVSVCGSDALVHGLARLDFANEALMQAWRDLMPAADHGLFTRDVFFHQTKAAAYLRALRKQPTLGEPPPLPADPMQTVQVFEPGDAGVPLMWQSHPSNYDREQNAKRHYLRSPMDDRSPWLLFADGDEVRAAVSRRAYELARDVKNPELADPETVQAFIEREHEETTYHPRYHGMYDDRYVHLGEPQELGKLFTAEGEAAEQGSLTAAHARLYGDELKSRMEVYHKRREEHAILGGLVHGSLELKGKDFPFRDGRCTAKDAPEFLKLVEKELELDHEWLGARDREVVRVHAEMAGRLDDGSRCELEDRYRFHMALQEILSCLSGHQARVQMTLGEVSGRTELSRDEFQRVLQVLIEAREALAAQLGEANPLRIPGLKNMDAGTPLAPFLLNKPLVRGLSQKESSFDGKWIGGFMEQLGGALERTRRLHFKSLGGILALQERIAEQWLSRHPVPETPAAQESHSSSALST